MAEFTDTDVTRLADILADLTPDGPAFSRHLARILLERGVTLPPPPPDPAVVVAHEVRRFGFSDDAVLAVRDLFTPEALAQAAAKVQEADRG